MLTWNPSVRLRLAIGDTVHALTVNGSPLTAVIIEALDEADALLVGDEIYTGTITLYDSQRVRIRERDGTITILAASECWLLKITRNPDLLALPA